MADKKPRSDDSQSVRLDDEDGVKEIIASSVFGLWDIANTLTRLRPTRREHYRVSIFGSARAKEGSFVYEEVKKLASELSALGCDIITGGGPGLMQAANEGANGANRESRKRSMGIRVRLPFEQNVNRFVDQAYEHQTFFTRLHHFALASDAFIVVPGGIGTVLETFMVWQLIQVNHLPPMPLILIGEMYQELVTWAERHLVSGPQQLANPEDMRIPTCVKSLDEAVALIRSHKASWSEHQANQK